MKRVKGHDYLYFAHSLKNVETGRHYLKWCYIGSARAVERAGGVSSYLEALRSTREGVPTE